MSKTLIRAQVLALFPLVAGCLGGPLPEDLDQAAQPISGALQWWGGAYACDAAQRETITAAVRIGKQIAATPEFAACVRSRVVRNYMSCRDANNGGRTAAHAQQVIDVSGASNGNALIIGCDASMNPGSGMTNGGDIHVFGHDEAERLRLGPVSAAATYRQVLSVAGTIWHEVMHTHGYLHDDGSAADCGYAAGEYVGNINGMPNIVGDCIEMAGLANRVGAFDGAGAGNAGTAQQMLTPGRWSGAADLAAVGDNRIGGFSLPVGARLRYCDNANGANGCVGPVETINFLHLPHRQENYFYRDHLDGMDNLTSFVEVTPTVVAWRDPNHLIAAQAYAVGTWRADQGHFGVVGNDAISSLLVPAGLVARVCQHESGGAGGGVCATVQDGVVSNMSTELGVSLENNISFIQVLPAVTIFQHTNLLGPRRSFRPGRYRADQGHFGAVLDNQVSSMVVPQGLRARLCDTAGTGAGGGTCMTYDRGVIDVGGFNDRASFLEVTTAP